MLRRRLTQLAVEERPSESRETSTTGIGWDKPDNGGRERGEVEGEKGAAESGGRIAPAASRPLEMESAEHVASAEAPWRAELQALEHRLAALETQVAHFESVAHPEGSVSSVHDEPPVDTAKHVSVEVAAATEVTGEVELESDRYPHVSSKRTQREVSFYSQPSMITEGEATEELHMQPTMQRSATQDTTKQSHIGSQLTEEEVTNEANKQLLHKLSCSVYEVTLLAGLPAIGRMGSILAVLGFIMNAVAQVLFIYLIRVGFIDELPTAASVARWRAEEGHLLSNMGFGTESSLVSRVCKQDETLTLSADKQALLAVVNLYETSGSGALLTSLVLLVWFFTFAMELNETFSFTIAVLNLKMERWTRIVRTSSGQISIRAISVQRKFAVLVVCLMRLCLALALLYEGTAWLASEIHLADLVLNAAALAFVLDLDEVMFSSLMSWSTKVLLSELEPLPKFYGRLHPVSDFMLPVFHLFVMVVFILSVGVLHVNPKSEFLRDVALAMCDGPQDFVISMHASGIILAADTNPFHMHTSHFQSAVQKIIEDGSPGGAGTVQMLPSVPQLRSYSGADTGAAMAILNQAVMQNGCGDYAFGEEGALPQIIATVRREFQNESLSHCEDLRQYCTGVQYIARIVCPDTCGCSLPRSGLWRSGAIRGCPTSVCQSADKYTAALAELPCEDPAPEALRNMSSWRHFWQQAERGNKTEQEIFMRKGCGGIATVSVAKAQTLCQGGAAVSSIADFCPEACDCPSSRHRSCPTACL